MGFDMNAVNQQMSSSIDQVGADMASQLDKTQGGEMSEEDMLQYQDSMNRWNIMINMQTNIQKTWGDALKAIASNFR